MQLEKHTRLHNCLGLLKIVTALPIPEPQTPVVAFSKMGSKS